MIAKHPSSSPSFVFGFCSFIDFFVIFFVYCFVDFLGFLLQDTLTLEQTSLLVCYKRFPIIKDKSNISRISNILNEYLFLVITGHKLTVLTVRVLN